METAPKPAKALGAVRVSVELPLLKDPSGKNQVRLDEGILLTGSNQSFLRRAISSGVSSGSTPHCCAARRL